MSRRPRTRGIVAAGAVAALLAGMTGFGTASPAEAVELPVPIVEYSFAEAPADGETVANLASASGIGPATIQNAASATFADKALVLPGGSKSSTGTWVRLPDGLLEDATAATVQMEVSASELMRSQFHFMWNIGSDSNAEYFFSALKCTDGRNPLVGIKTAAMGERLVQAHECGWEANQWLSVTSVITEGKVAQLFIDGEQVASGAVSATPGDVADQTLNAIGRSPWPDALFQGATSTFRVYDEALSPEQIAELSTQDARLHAEAMETVVANELADIAVPATVDGPFLPLPTNGGSISWSSSDTSVVTEHGKVTQPARGSDPVQVTLTASAEHRGFTASKEFTIEVQPSAKSDEDMAAQALETFVVPPVVSTATQLPAAPEGFTVKYETSAPLALESNQLTIPDGNESAEGTVRATLQKGAASPVVKTFRVRVLDAESASEILAYHRTPTSDREANNADIAYSMHLAKADGDTWQPFNDNYGIFFARTAQVPTNAVDVRLDVRSLRDPFLFRMEDGTFGVVAIRTNRGSASVHPEDPPGTILVARSEDLLTYEEAPNGQSLMSVGETNGVNDPYVVFDSASGRYVIGWRDDAGLAKYTTCDELGPDCETDGIRLGSVSLAGHVDASSASIDDYVGGHSLPVEASLVKNLDTRFTTIENTGVEEFPDLTIQTGDAVADLSLPSSAELTYSDGSRAVKAIDGWDLAGLAQALDSSGETFAQPGTYELTGRINRQADYPLPFAEDRADPSVYKWEWKHDGTSETKFLMIATNDIDGDVVWQKGTPHMPIRMADDILGLADTPGDPSGLITPQGFNAKESILLEKGDVNADGEPFTGSFWAPELHEIDGTLSILFMPSYNSVWSDGAAAIMQLKKGADGDDLDPTVAENWTVPKTVTRADGSPLSTRADGTIGMSLDMSYFQDDAGQSYYVWQQLGAVYLATFDTSDPYTLTSDPVLIVSPEYAWDNAIAEGPNVLNRDGKLYLLYSGSSVGVTYTTGLAIGDASGATNLLDPAAWPKLNYPIQKSAIFDGQWQLGTGHGMWSEDEHGELLYVFHAYAPHTEGYSNRSGRDMYVRRVHWAADGMPVLEMSVNQEVAEDAVARIRVTVLPDGDLPSEYRATTVSAARNSAVGWASMVWGTADTAKSVRTQVQLPDGTWSTSQIVTPSVGGGYRIPLTYGKDSAGSLTWRVVTEHADGTVETSAAFVQTRFARPTATSAGSAPVGRTANVWGTVDGQNQSPVWTEVRLPDGRWSKSQVGLTKTTGGYVLELTYGKHAQPASYRWRVAADYPGVGVLRSNEFTFTRR